MWNGKPDRELDVRHDVPTPRLIDSRALEKSDVVANACMNRERNLEGANSYEKDLGFSPLDFLTEKLTKQATAAWLDLCCGTGRALMQAAEACRTAAIGDRTKLVGVDLIPMFDPIRPGLDCLRLIEAPLPGWNTADRFDLVTCVHGLHYVGDKLGLLYSATEWLRNDGLLIAHLDFRNVRIHGRASSGAQIGKDLRRSGFRYIPGRRLLTHHAPGPKNSLPYVYLGADVDAGPNYTGQSAIDSYYDRKPGVAD